MRKFRNWLINKFLPAWAKDTVFRENAALKAEIEKQEQEIRRLNAYISGLENGMRAQRRIVIQNGVSK